MKAQMNVKEFMETQKNSNAKEVYVMYSPHMAYQILMGNLQILMGSTYGE